MTRLMHGLFNASNSDSSLESGHSYDGYTSIILDVGSPSPTKIQDSDKMLQRYRCLKRLKISNCLLVRMINLFFFIIRIFLFLIVLLLCLTIIIVGYWCGSVTNNEWHQNQTISISYLFLSIFFFLLGSILSISTLVITYDRRSNFRIDCLFICGVFDILEQVLDQPDHLEKSNFA